jgi:flagellar biosynthesis protein FlhF
VAEAFRELVRRTVRVTGSLLPAEGRQRVVALVGPTGVGKTTTVAKLAARFALQEGRKVGLVTVDTYRVAAAEQLRKFADIMEVPLRVALDAAELRRAVADSANRDLVLVDTAGQSPRDEQALLDLLGFFEPGMDAEVHLVLSVTTRARDLERILKHYEPLKPSRLLLTKLDETECHGALLGLPLASRLPLSYLTTGQNVPDDIEEAAADRVADYLLRGWGAEDGP